MSERLCACGCGASLAGMRVDARWRSEMCRKRFLRKPRVSRARPSGLQVSYPKAVEAVAQEFGSHRRAARALKAALSDRQRERLEAA